MQINNVKYIWMYCFTVVFFTLLSNTIFVDNSLVMGGTSEYLYIDIANIFWYKSLGIHLLYRLYKGYIYFYFFY